MTDNEIVKALKEILEIMCVVGDLQKASTISKSIDLINRQEAEIERLKERCQKCGTKTTTTILHLQTVIAERNAEIESLKAEIERLKNAYRQCAYERDAYIEIENTSIIEAKTEAYKEFAERLKERGRSSLGNQFVIGWIDNLLKEMVGDNNE